MMEKKDSVPLLLVVLLLLPLQTILANERQAYSCQNSSHLPERFSLVVTPCRRMNVKPMSQLSNPTKRRCGNLSGC